MPILNVGDIAPDFEANSTSGKIKLSDFKGKRVVLYFYVKDQTPGCTTQSVNLQNGLEDLKKLNIVVIGISVDPLTSHKIFAKRHNLTFPLIADDNKEISKLYGVLNERGRASRVTFIIDENGVIRHIFNKVNVSAHKEEIVKVLDKI